MATVTPTRRAIGMVRVSQKRAREVTEVAEVFAAVDQALGLPRLGVEINALPMSGQMQRWARQATREDIREARRPIAQRGLDCAPGATFGRAVERYLDEHREPCRRLGALTRRLAREGDTDPAGLALAVRQLRGLVE